MKALIYIFILSVLLVGCEEDSIDNADSSPKLTVVDDNFVFDNLNDINSDAFDLNEVWIEESQLMISVSYSGGCELHEFELLWPEIVIDVFPPDISVVLIHDANSDMCEAYLTEVLKFDLTSNSLHLSPDEMEHMRVSVINGSNTDNVVVNK